MSIRNGDSPIPAERRATMRRASSDGSLYGARIHCMMR